ncbi:uncharacterized protein [Littorina saxatilis]|uniref:Uncharacterized protein n=1 Tax=Littorina saxatilis TaxID=31220 RepID=A0AAN9BMG9_9CAEN
MLHITTEVGKVGKKERERRHYPQVHNLPSVPMYKAQGRLFIPHNYGTNMEWVPHGQYIEPEVTESGPDWSSRLRYIPDPENPEYPAAEIWPNNWRSMRPYPSMCVLSDTVFPDLDDNNNNNDNDNNNSDGTNSVAYNNCEFSFEEPAASKNVTFQQRVSEASHQCKPPYEWPEESIEEYLQKCFLGDRGKRKGIWTYKRSDKEWLLDPGLTKVGLRCTFNGEHKATSTSESELTHSMLLGKGRPENMIDKRNEMTEASPGDKSYQAAEYSPSFHKLGCTRPLTRYGPARSMHTPDTFIPLMPLFEKSREPYVQKEKGRQVQKEIDEVRRLEAWKPATPLIQTIPVIEDKKKPT